MTSSQAAVRENSENQNIEIRLFLEAVYLKYGYDFRNYSRAHIKRRILNLQRRSELGSILEMTHRTLYDPEFFASLLTDFSINVSEIFRDPPFFSALRREVIPLLKTYPFINIWHAGCASGEEVYSMAILLQEEELLKKTQLYATDFNEEILEKAREGVFPIDQMKAFTQNYQRAGGKQSFADYYTARNDTVIFDPALRKHMIFADHNLVTDRVFGEMQMIVCRNVLIYFNRELQHRVIRLFLDSLAPGGVLCLGTKETLQFSGFADRFDPLVESEKIYKKRL